MRTEDAEYARRLEDMQGAWWKRLVPVQLPYRAHLKALRLGAALEVGCGIGRNLAALSEASVGVDHNAAGVARARARGFCALTPEEFRRAPLAVPGRFDALLVSHVLEHMTAAEAVSLLREYLPFLRAGGRAVIVTPQEAGFRSDPTHVELMDFARVAAICAEVGLEAVAQYSFPFPRPIGRAFKYNEFVTIARQVPGSREAG